MRIILIILVFLSCGPIAAAQDTIREPYADSLRYVVDNEKDTMQVLRSYIKYIDLMEDAGLQYNYSLQMLDLAIAYGDSSMLYEGYNHAGYYSNRFGLCDEGLEYSFKGLEIAEGLLNNSFIANSLANIGSYYASTNNVSQSVDYYILAQKVAENTSNYSVLEQIYYNLAILYMEREVYSFGVEYLEKAQDAHVKSGLYTGNDLIEYDLTIKLCRLLLHFSRRDTLNALALLDTLNSKHQEAMEIESFAGQANTSMGICDGNLRALDIAPQSSRQHYLSQAKLYLDMLDSVIEVHNVQWLKPESYNYLNVQYQMAVGNFLEVRQYIDNPDYITAESDRIKAQIIYNTHFRNFRRVLECMHQYRIQTNSVLSMQSAAKYENLALQFHYQNLVEEIEHQATTRNREYQRSHTFNTIILILVACVFLVLIAIIWALMRSHRSNNRIKDELEASTTEISMQNSMLNQMQEEYLEQNDEIMHQNHIIENQRDKLALINHSLQKSIMLASDIQRAVIYDEWTMRDNVGDCFVFWKPLFKVSGDFYWATRVGDRQILLAADCTGHGVPGALLSMYGISMLNDYVRRNADCNAADILNIIKAAFMEQFVRGDKDFVDGMDCALVIISRSRMTVDFAGARRPLIKISNGEVSEIKPDKICIGNNILRNNATFTNSVVHIEKDDMLYVFSDGIADQFGDEDCATKFGNRQLKELLGEVSYLETRIQKSVIDSAVQNWASGPFLAGLAERTAPQLDDQLLIGVRV